MCLSRVIRDSPLPEKGIGYKVVTTQPRMSFLSLDQLMKADIDFKFVSFFREFIFEPIGVWNEIPLGEQDLVIDCDNDCSTYPAGFHVWDQLYDAERDACGASFNRVVEVEYDSVVAMGEQGSVFRSGRVIVAKRVRIIRVVA